MKTTTTIKTISLTACLAFTLPAFGAEMFSNLSFEAASKEAAAANKILLIDFYTTWCGPCKMLDKNTWSDAAVIELVKQKAIALKLDAEKQTNLAKQYHIEAYPTVLLLKADGTEIDRLVGYKDPKAFIADFDSTMAGKDSVTRAREKMLADGTNNPSGRMQYAMALAQKRMNAEALAEYLWCYDHGVQANPAFAGVRASFLMNYIKSLAQAYPPAKKELETRRDACLVKVTSGSPDAEAVGELFALNRALGEEKKNLEIYDKLPAGSQARERVQPQLTEQFLNARRYSDVLQGKDPVAAFKQSVERFNTTMGRLAQDSPMRKQMESGLRLYTVNDGAHYFEAEAGLKQNQKAKELAGQILKFDPSGEARAILTKAAERAKNPELTQFLKN